MRSVFLGSQICLVDPDPQLRGYTMRWRVSFSISWSSNTATYMTSRRLGGRLSFSGAFLSAHAKVLSRSG